MDAEARLEWLYRLGAEPKRLWKHYLVVGPKIFWLWVMWGVTLRKAAKQSLG